MFTRRLRLWASAGLACLAVFTSAARSQETESIIKRISGDANRLEMTFPSSRILTLEKKIKEAIVDNPEVVDVKPLAANKLQVVAKKSGFTTITLKDEDEDFHTIELLVMGDVRELLAKLRAQGIGAKIKAIPLATKVVLAGTVDDPSQVSRIVATAQDYFPEVINAISVGGVRQVLLNVRVMEVSRTKLRTLGFDFAQFVGDDFAVSSVSGLITAFSDAAVTTSTSETFSFARLNNGNAFFGVLEALRQNNLAKVLAEPNMVAVSGRAAFFNVGGEFPILVPQSLGTVSVEYKKFGTQVDFIPIVLANGAIRLEVRPRVSEIDPTRSVVINNLTIPGLRTRECETGVELQAGQTLAIAGLVQMREESETRGLPWLMDIPYVGAGFRRVNHVENEIELVILVTPHLVEPMDCDEVPAVGPGLQTASPTDIEAYWKGYVEKPACCPADSGAHPVMLGPHGYDEGVQGVEEVPPPKGGASGAPSTPSTTRRPDAGRSSVQRLAPSAAAQGSSSPYRASNPQNRSKTPPSGRNNSPSAQPGFLGETGYDVRK
ncbi:MAG: type II and III secretion system protein family protein [Planctomycetia bacterium]|nr:type II and III secretion system protein family protein [Planctomycetia bacterium]